MLISEILSIIAVVISGLALLHSVNSSKHQRELTLRETELVRLQLSKELAEQRRTSDADISARMFKQGKNDWRVKIYNRGPSDATNVEIEISDESCIMSSDLKRKFPMKSLKNGHSVELVAAVHLQSKSKEEILISWLDGKGKRQKSSITLTL